MKKKLQKLTQEKKTTQNVIVAEWITTKLIELSKKRRDQTVEMETLKTKCKNLEATLIFKDDMERQRTELR